MARTRQTEVHATTSSGHRSRVKLFIAANCSACAEAKTILQEAGVKFSTVVVDPHDAMFSRSQIVSGTRRKTGVFRFALPRLMIGAHQVGSLDRIKALFLEGKLRQVLDQG